MEPNHLIGRHRFKRAAHLRNEDQRRRADHEAEHPENGVPHWRAARHRVTPHRGHGGEECGAEVRAEHNPEARGHREHPCRDEPRVNNHNRERREAEKGEPDTEHRAEEGISFNRVKERHHGSTVFDRGRDVADQREREHHHTEPHQDPPELTECGIRLLHEEVNTDRDEKGRHRVDIE